MSTIHKNSASHDQVKVKNVITEDITALRDQITLCRQRITACRAAYDKDDRVGNQRRAAEAQGYEAEIERLLIRINVLRQQNVVHV